MLDLLSTAPLAQDMDEDPYPVDGNQGEDGDPLKVKGRSIGHHMFKQNKLVFLLLVFKTGARVVG